MTKTQIKNLLAQLRAARAAATFESASHYPFEKDQDAKNAALAELTRVYRETWILQPLDVAIKMLTDSCCADCDRKLPGPYGTPGVALARTRPNVLLCSKCGVNEAFRARS